MPRLSRLRSRRDERARPGCDPRYTACCRCATSWAQPGPGSSRDICMGSGELQGAMVYSRAHLTAAVTLAMSVTAVASAGQGGRNQPPAPAKRLSATKVTEAPTLDGVLDDRVWQEATPDRRLRAGRAGRRVAGHRAHRSASGVRRQDALHRRDVLRLRSVADRDDRLAARFVAERAGLVPDDLRHLSRSAERLHLRHQRRRHASTTRRCGTKARRCGAVRLAASAAAAAARADPAAAST